MEKIEKCPYCGSTKNVIGKQSTYAKVCPNKKIALREETLYHVICLKCGTVIRSYVKNPENLVVKKDTI